MPHYLTQSAPEEKAVGSSWGVSQPELAAFPGVAVG